jgi:hypothetical protein
MAADSTPMTADKTSEDVRAHCHFLGHENTISPAAIGVQQI